MQLFKLGALTALGALLAMPAMAQGSYQGMPQNQGGGYSGFNQAMNSRNGYGGSGQTNYTGGFNAPGAYANQGNQNIPRAGNPPSGDFGPNMYGQNMPMHMHMQRHRFHHRVAHEVHGLRHALQRAGFTDVHIVPRSFLVQAQDEEGRHVLMIISPHAIQALTAFNTGASGHGMNMRHQGMMNQGRMAGNYGQSNSGWTNGNQR